MKVCRQVVMLRFIQEVASKPWTTAVLGNCSADMDSVFGALSLAYLLSVVGTMQTRGVPVLPVVNIPREDLPLRTELVSTLALCGIATDRLSFAPELDLSSKSVILYDHNQLSPSQSQ